MSTFNVQHHDVLDGPQDGRNELCWQLLVGATGLRVIFVVNCIGVNYHKIFGCGRMYRRHLVVIILLVIQLSFGHEAKHGVQALQIEVPALREEQPCYLNDTCEPTSELVRHFTSF